MGNPIFDEYFVKDGLLFGDAVDGLDNHYNKQLSKLTLYIKTSRITNFITVSVLFDDYYIFYRNSLEKLFNDYHRSFDNKQDFLYYNGKIHQIKDRNQQLYLDTTENYFIDL